MAHLTKQPIKRLFKRAGAKRVSDKAIILLADVVEKRATEMVKEAKKLAEHSNRRTVMKEDVRMASKTAKR